MPEFYQDYTIEQPFGLTPIKTKLPTEGAIFRSDTTQSAPVLIKRVGGQLVTLPVSQYAGDYNTLPILTITGEQEQAFERIRGTASRIRAGTSEEFQAGVPTPTPAPATLPVAGQPS